MEVGNLGYLNEVKVGRGWQLRRYAGNKSMILTIRGPGGDDQLPASVNPDSWTHVAAVWGGGYRSFL